MYIHRALIKYTVNSYSMYVLNTLQEKHKTKHPNTNLISYGICHMIEIDPNCMLNKLKICNYIDYFITQFI